MLERNWDLLAEYRAKPCAVCSRRPTDPHHVRTVGAGGEDVDFNLLPLCRLHHSEWHSLGAVTFLKRHFSLRWHLEQKGWRIENVLGKETLVFTKGELGDA